MHYRHSQGAGEQEIPCKFTFMAESALIETFKTSLKKWNFTVYSNF